jgi:Cu+-exporting ATPase
MVKLRPDMFSLMAAGIAVSWIAGCVSFIVTAAHGGFAGLAHLGHGSHAAGNVLPLYLDTTCAIVALAALGRWLEARAMRIAQRSMNIATSELPDAALRLVASRPIETPVVALEPADHILIPVGSRLAADGIVIDGSSQIDESLLTGEALPITRAPGDSVLGGSINLGPQPLTVKVTKSASDAYVNTLKALMLAGHSSKTSTERLADRVSGVFVPVVFALAIITLLAWWLIGGDLQSGVLAMTAVLVAACPCALGLAVPMTMTAATGILARQGVLLTDATALERAGTLRTIALDKTGTLSLARPIVTQAQGDEHILHAARVLARSSLHPVAQAIAASGPSQGQVSAVTETAGQGMQGIVDGQHITLRKSESPTADGTLTLIEVDGVPAGSFTLQAPLKPNARAAIQRLTEQGLTCIMLSGDQPAAVNAAADQLSITRYYSQVKPEDKLRLIQDLTRTSPGSVAMAGDGINDAAALAAADIGIAMGTGSDLAKRAGHLILLRDCPGAIADAIDLSRQIMRRIRITLALAFVYNIILLPVAAMGLLSPMLAAGAMALSSVSVILGSMLGWGGLPKRGQMPRG